MFDLLARFHTYRRQLLQTRQMQRLSRVDESALAPQAEPRAGRVLIVRNDSIGDYLLYRPWLRRMAEELHARGSHLTLAANALWAPLAREWDADLFDELLVVDFGRFQRDLTYRAATLATVGAGGYGTLIYPLHVREPAVENFFRFLRAPERVGSQGEHRTDPWFVALDQGYTCLLPTARATRFEYDRNQEFFENWRGHPDPHPAPLGVPSAAAAVARFQAELGPKYLVLFPGASARAKRWPAARFAQLARALHEHYGAEFALVLAGSPDDAGHAHQIRQALGGAPYLIDYCGRTSLPELAALLRGARLLVSNDTVAAHLAVQASTPCITVLMGENYGKFFPYPAALQRAPSRCLFPPSMEARFAQGNFTRPDFTPKIGDISPERAFEAAVKLLSRG